MLYEYRNQPARGLYLTYWVLSTILFWAPLWLLLSIPHSWRPRRSWSFKKTFMMNVTKGFIGLGEKIGVLNKVPDHLAIAPGDDVKGVWVEPTPHLIIGDLEVWASLGGVDPIWIPGYWIDKFGYNIEAGAPPMPGEKVILALHGGGYVCNSGHPSDGPASIIHGLLEHTDSVHRVFSLEYRLSNAAPYEAANPFPAAILDTIAAYNYLVNTVGFSPEDIIIEGDSAGGGLALAITRYLIENQNIKGVDMPAPPGALILNSPWCDAGSSHVDFAKNISGAPNADYIEGVKAGYNFPVTAYMGPHGTSVAGLNPYISPASLYLRDPTFKGFPRTFISAGTAEALLPQIRTLKERMVKDLGEGYGVKESKGKVRYHEAEDAVHDYVALTFWEPERSDTLREISAWIKMQP